MRVSLCMLCAQHAQKDYLVQMYSFKDDEHGSILSKLICTAIFIADLHRACVWMHIH